MRPRPLRWRGKEPPSRLYLENRVALCQLQYTSVVSLQEISDWLCYLVSYLTRNSKKYIFRSLSLQKLIEMVAGPGEDLREMIARLEQQELDCQVMEDPRKRPSLEKGSKSSLHFKKKQSQASTLPDGQWECACPSLHRTAGSLPCRWGTHKVGGDKKSAKRLNNFKL